MIANEENAQLVNPTLYWAIRRASRQNPAIQSPGQPRLTQTRNGRTEVTQRGEQYHVNCPYCGDTKGRLSISAAYDPVTAPELAHCFNNGCLSKPANRVKLGHWFMAVWREAQSYRHTVPPVPCSSCDQSEPALPEGFIPLSELDNQHPARSYVSSRKFDADLLANEYGVGYSASSSMPAPQFTDRLIIPLYDVGGELRGWQARTLRDAQHKYLTSRGYQRSRHVYHCRNISSSPGWLIVCEGATDAWRLGPTAVALLGKTASPQQLDAIKVLARNRDRIVIALDSDAQSEASKLRQQIEHLTPDTPVTICSPPAGAKDFAELSTTDAVATINQAVLPVGRMASVVAHQAQAVTLANPAMDAQIVSARQLLQHAGIVPQADCLTGLRSHLEELGMLSFFDRIERPVLPILHEMQATGIAVDRTELDRFAAVATAKTAMRHIGHDGRVRPCLHSLGTRTGRITTTTPNLQGLKREARAAFVADPGRMFIGAEYRQYEVRILALLVADPLLRQMLSEPSVEFYSWVARELGNGDRNETKRVWQRWLNTHSGQGRNSQYVRLNEMFPVVRSWCNNLAQRASEQGMVVTPDGRRMTLVDVRRNLGGTAVSRMIQGTAADIFKLQLIRLQTVLNGRARMLLPFYDFVLCDAPVDLVSSLATEICASLEAPWCDNEVSLRAQVEMGTTWATVTI